MKEDRGEKGKRAKGEMEQILKGVLSFPVSPFAL